MAQGHHYIRDGKDAELLFDLNTDPFEMINLLDRTDGELKAAGFRQMLLEFLTANPASEEIENAYRNRFTQRLRSQVRGAPNNNQAESAD